MTPKSSILTPSVTASVDDGSDVHASENDSGDESLPPHTSEIGTLKKLPNHGTAWLGSSSGVYFVNTVRRAFSAAFVNTNNDSLVPASEDILTGDDAEGRNYNGPITEQPTLAAGQFQQRLLEVLGRPPSDRKLAMDLVTTFFRNWHPLFPFLHGPRFLEDINHVYAATTKTDAQGSVWTSLLLRKVVTFQIIVNIASLDRSDLSLPNESRIKSTTDVTRTAGCLAVSHDIATIQALIASELYLVATISLRQASTVAGMILKLIYHAGLHRCPLRYAQLSVEDCEIRRRIFWSAYALDRHLSLSLGDPNTVQDSDIDVCLSGRELHKAVASDLVVDPSEELRMHLPMPRVGPHGAGAPSDDPRVVDMNSGPQAREKQLREAAMTAYVHYGKLTGRIIEIFHKSIHARFPKQESILYLNSDVENWWNDMPSALTGHDTSSSSDSDQGTKNPPHHRQLAPFFMVLYQQLLLLLNRPRLSLDQSTAEFQHGLQVCIRASRETISALKKHKDNGQSMLLPGLLSASWMAGLIIAFACQLGKYSKFRACIDIKSCLSLLNAMGCRQWFTVKNCYKVLSLLLDNIQSRKASTNGFLSVSRPDAAPSMTSSVPSTTGSQNRKRSHPTDDPTSERSPKRDIAPDTSLADSNNSQPLPSREGVGRTSTTSQRRGHRPHGSAQIDLDQFNGLWPQNDWKNASSGPTSEPQPGTFQLDENFLPPNDPIVGGPAAMGSALYADPRDMAFAQSSHHLDVPLADMQSSTTEDPMFWGNLDFNISDIFGAASWENITGPTGPMGNNGGMTSMWGDLNFGGGV